MSRWRFEALGCLALLACHGEVDGESEAGSPSGAGGHMPSGSDGGAPQAVGCEEAPAAGVATPLRRLSRSQYAHAVRDLFAGALGNTEALKLGQSASARIPVDDRVGPFAANPLAPVSDAHGRAFMDAARMVAAKASEPGSAARLLPCKSATDEACVEAFVASFGRRAFRSPLSATLTRELLSLYHRGAMGGTGAEGLRLMLEAMLQAPDFLYHVEDQGRPDALPAFELASRLAFFLWDAPPDETLLDAAASGALASSQGLKAQAERMLGDPRARQALDRFAAQWLHIENIETLARDPKRYPRFAADVASAMKQETLDFFADVVLSQRGSLSTLLSASKWAVPDALLPLYAASRPFLASASTPIELPRQQRAGILTHASVLTATSHMDHTSPVKRGVFLLDNVLCYDIPLPQGLEIPPLPDPDPKQTTRERFAVHTQQVACAACHKVIDPLGFALEEYDAVGGYREQEDGKAIDREGVLAVDDPELDGRIVGGVALAQKLANSSKVAACMVKQVHRFATGHEVLERDACTLTRLERRFANANFNLRELLLAVVLDDGFRKRAPAPPGI